MRMSRRIRQACSMFGSGDKKTEIDLVLLRKQLEIDEGVKHEIYLDHLGYPTFGIGHLIQKFEFEEGMPVGTVITEQRVNEAFLLDVKVSIEDCKALFSKWDTYPQEAKQVFANMAFNLGRGNLSKFKKMIKAAESADWMLAAVEGRDSRWYKQVTNRAERLMTRLENT
jgi:lysozyme